MLTWAPAALGAAATSASATNNGTDHRSHLTSLKSIDCSFFVRVPSGFHGTQETSNKVRRRHAGLRR